MVLQVHPERVGISFRTTFVIITRKLRDKKWVNRPFWYRIPSTIIIKREVIASTVSKISWVVRGCGNFNEIFYFHLGIFQLLIIKIVHAYAYYTHLSLLFNLTSWLCTYLRKSRKHFVPKKELKNFYEAISCSFHRKPRQHWYTDATHIVVCVIKGIALCPRTPELKFEFCINNNI